MKTTVLNPSDMVGISFFVTSMALLAATVFFFFERQDAPRHWRTSMTIMGMVTGIAFVHYLYMRELWIVTQQTPIVYRYIDWLITVPLQIIEFYLILRAIGYQGTKIFWKLSSASLIMLWAGYVGESGLGDALGYFLIGMLAWVYILYEIFIGEAAHINRTLGDTSTQTAFNALRLIVSIGWAIYPIGYTYGYLYGSEGQSMLNLIYNYADFVNKIAFGLIIWQAAQQQPHPKKA